MKLVIPLAGFGSRMRPHTWTKPKPLINVAGKPFLGHLLDKFASLQIDELVVIYSECGPANPKYYERVLRKNLGIPAGAFAIRDIGGKPNFVMVDTVLAGMVTPSVLARKIENIASRADIVEKSLTKEDRR